MKRRMEGSWISWGEFFPPLISCCCVVVGFVGESGTDEWGRQFPKIGDRRVSSAAH